MPLVALLRNDRDAAQDRAARAYLAALPDGVELEVREVGAAEVADRGGVTVLKATGAFVCANVDPADPLQLRSRAGRRLYLVRHGEADTPAADGTVRSHAPLPLTPRGREQADALCAALADVDTPVVHASGIARAHETAQRLAGPRELRLHAGLRELRLGDLEGALLSEVLRVQPGFLVEPDATLPGGESLREVGERAWPALQAILREQEGDVIVVAHGGVNRALLAPVLGVPLEDILTVRQDWACVNVLEHTEGAWHARVLNWTPEGLGELRHAWRTVRLHEAEWRQPMERAR